ncbi:diaminobutyrate--2-oxoglutarate transaminase [Bacillus horti]|uniref:Diaminobutyrate--2-oxoglutarate transaminase n=1 Tax=Caldalkalibacillus horti TaxID=77523 RepID=A0ABT9W2Z8_9BACI|nr:diaminobutyrate--2-oxoglutarate transaminase [Bacillus horti]MDQ0167624.1 diaminobutyrate-2-oxoglutarate transaminase [Bacillus horti]
MNVFELVESNVRSYCRAFPVVFQTAENAKMYGESNEAYIDFLAGAGALNYGHNPPFIKERLIQYIQSNGVMHGLDMYTTAKRDFIETFTKHILLPRNLNYKMQFCGPTGTNAVEAALKLARKVKGRTGIFSFMGGFHGMSLGSIAATGNLEQRAGAGIPLQNVTFMPYPYGYAESFDTIEYMESILMDPNSGIEKPAAILVETVQAEGGIIVAPTEWLIRLRKLCTEHDILMICDDIQVGCGRAGQFFSFERAEIVPDIVTLSKSIGGYGLPLSLVLLKPELDIWKPAEHNGTFRGNQLAFVAAMAAIEYREEIYLEKQVEEKEAYIEDFLVNEIMPIHEDIKIRGIGMIWGIDFTNVTNDSEVVKRIARACFDNKLIIERVGRNDLVLKIMPPLTIEMEVLQEGCAVIKQAIVSHIEAQIHS